MLFRQSAVTELTRDKVVEEATHAPIGIQPALLGTGEITLALDATGMQGLNSNLPQYVDAASYVHGSYLTERFCHLYHDEALSRHYINKAQRGGWPMSYSHLPCGYLDYTLTIDGRTFTADDIAEHARDWRREMQPRDGRVDVGYTLGSVRFHLACVMPLHSVEAVFGYDWESTDGRDHDVSWAVRCVLRLRDAGPIARGGMTHTVRPSDVIRTWHATTPTATADIYQPIELSWAWGASREVQQVSPIDEPDALGLTIRDGGGKALGGFVLISGSDRDGTHGLTHATRRLDQIRGASIEQLLQVGCESWRNWFSQAVELHIGDPEKEFITAQSQYLLRAGLGWHSGLPLSAGWTQKFAASTFWDSFFAADGMTRAGHAHSTVRQFGDWLVKTAHRRGRPHYWMSYYDGKPSNDPATDVAIQSVLAFAGAMIRLYEVTRDTEDLRHRVLPYLELVSAFLLENNLRRLPDEAGWDLKGAIAGDIGIDHHESRGHNTYLLWIVMTLAKYAQYAKQLGQSSELIETCAALADHFRAKPIRLSPKAEWYAWILYLAPATPFMDLEDYRENFRNPGWRDNPAHEKTSGYIFGGQYTGMAWGNTSHTASLLMAGLPDQALEYFDGTLKFVSGQGHLTEGAYESHVGGNTPYVPSSGSWLSAVCDFFVTGDLWTGSVGVMTRLPALWRYQHLRVERVRSPNGAVVSVDYAPDRLDATVSCPEPRRVTFALPGRIVGEPLQITLNGQPAPDPDLSPTLTLDLPAGTHTLRVRRDLQTPFDVLLIEPFDHGAELVELIREAGLSCRWLRDLHALPRVIDGVKAILWDGSFTALPPGTTMRIAAAVERGATLVALYHAGARAIDADMAKLLGVNADFDVDWKYTVTPVVWEHTATGRSMPAFQSQHFTLNSAKDVEAIYVDAQTRQPTVTRRRVGRGYACWLATGSRIMGWNNPDVNTLRIPEVFVMGHDRDKEASRPWIKHPPTRQLIGAFLRGEAVHG